MPLFGRLVARIKAVAGSLSPVRATASSWFGSILESFSGAWQRNIVVESTQNILAFSAVYSCVSIISDDIAKLRIMLTKRAVDGVWDELESNSPFLPVLRKPNRYQTRIQFLSQWLTMKLLYGNAYILLSRDKRGVVEEMYPLDPRMVTPMVAHDGDVFYQLSQDALTNVPKPVLIPMSEIIHDRMVTLFHPLLGVSPIYACGASATQGIRIQAFGEKFFQNMSRPSGILTAPNTISDETAARLKKDFEANYGGANLGRLLVGGDGLKYEPMMIPANDAQLIEQQKWTVEDVARAFHVPLYKIQSGAHPTFTNAGAMNQDYYTQTLQSHIEAIELLLDEALGLPKLGMGVELDLEGLLRMDPLARADKNEKAIRAGYMKPDEARLSENLHPVPGGDTPYLQQQQYSLLALSKRDAKDDPFGTKPPAPPAPPADDNDESGDQAKAFAGALIKTFNEARHAQRPV